MALTQALIDAIKSDGDINDTKQNQEIRAALQEVLDDPAGGTTYSSYVALLSQTGTNDPTATVLHNDLSGAIVWTRPTFAGQYLGTLVGEFPENKTYLFIQNTYGVTYILPYIYWSSVNEISIETVDTSTDTAKDDELYNTSIEIRVYP